MLATDDTWSAKQAASFLGCTPRTLRRWVASGKLRAVTKFEGLTGAYVFSAADVRAFKAAQERAVRNGRPEAP